MTRELKLDGLIRLTELEIPGCRVYVSPDSLLLMPEDKREEMWAHYVDTRTGPAVLWLEALEHGMRAKMKSGKAI